MKSDCFTLHKCVLSDLRRFPMSGHHCSLHFQRFAFNLLTEAFPPTLHKFFLLSPMVYNTIGVPTYTHSLNVTKLWDTSCILSSFIEYFYAHCLSCCITSDLLRFLLSVRTRPAGIGNISLLFLNLNLNNN